jgi:alkylation response protein AidB-like acyl-CoA dehydrogenase
MEEVARVDPSIALTMAAHNGLCSSHIHLFGSEQQKQKWLAPLARGERLGGWGLTESTSGSDAVNMRTTAARDGGAWVLNGAKTFTTHGRIADTLVVMAVTDRAAGTHGVSAFIVDRGTPGLSAGKKEDKLGMRASDTSEVLLDNCRVPADQLLGEVHHGFLDVMQVLDAGRIGIAALSVGLAQGGLRRRAGVREGTEGVRQDDRQLSGHSMEARRQRRPDRSRAALDVSRRVAERSRRPRDHLESSMAKLYASEIAVRAAKTASRSTAATASSKDYPAEKYFRDVKLMTIGEGTSEIQRLVIARQLLAR